MRKKELKEKSYGSPLKTCGDDTSGGGLVDGRWSLSSRWSLVVRGGAATREINLMFNEFACFVLVAMYNCVLQRVGKT